LRLSDYHEALIAFRQARTCDKDYKKDIVSLNIIHCLFQLADSFKKLKRCADKLSNYLTNYPTNEPNTLISTMVDYFKTVNIHVDHTAVYDQDPGTPKKKLRPLEPKSTQSNWEIPADAKEATKKALQTMSFMSDRSLASRETDLGNEYKIDPQELHPLGDGSRHIYMYLDPRKISENRKQEYIRVIEKKRVGGTASKGQSCPKKLSNGRWEIKIPGKYRALSTRIYTLFGEPTITTEGDTVTQKKTVIIIGKEKTHNQVSKATR